MIQNYQNPTGGGSSTQPSYTPNPRFDIDTILSGFPLSNKVGEERYIGDAIGFPIDVENFANDVACNWVSFSGSYYYSGQSEDFSLPIGFNAGNYVCFIFSSCEGPRIFVRLYMAPVETMAYKEVALLEYDPNNDIWNVTPVN